MHFALRIHWNYVSQCCVRVRLSNEHKGYGEVVDSILDREAANLGSVQIFRASLFLINFVTTWGFNINTPFVTRACFDKMLKLCEFALPWMFYSFLLIYIMSVFVFLAEEFQDNMSCFLSSIK